MSSLKIFALAFAALNLLQTEGLAARSIPFAQGLRRPIGIKFDRKGDAYIVEQHGKIKKFSSGKTAVFIDVSDRITEPPGSEQGLLDIALDPSFEKNGRFFLHYTDRKGDTVISEFSPGRGERFVLQQKQPYRNHNGGQIEFGPDGFLYIALGDGGSRDDPEGNGQNPETLLGKILRIDVREPGKYKIPDGNPFRAKANHKPEIWALGLRNPWRFSFDGSFLYIGDVGQNKWEEIDVEDTRRGGGNNYGWNVLEGRECLGDRKCDPAGLVPPVHVYALHKHGDCSVIGGYVYRGAALPQLKGLYLYSDFCSGRIYSFLYKDGKASHHRDWPELNPGKANWQQVSSLGRDPSGELYVVSYDQGAVFKIVP